MRLAFALIVLGAVGTVIGVGMVYVPAAVILAGLSTAGLGVLAATGTSRRSVR